VGHDQIRFVKPLPPVDQNIQIQGAGAVPPFAPAPPQGRLDGLEGFQQLPRRPGGAKGQRQDLVQKKGLVRIAPGFGFIPGTLGRHNKVRERCQALPGRVERGLPVAQIGAKADVGDYNLAMRDKASSIRATGTVMAMRK